MSTLTVQPFGEMLHGWRLDAGMSLACFTAHCGIEDESTPRSWESRGSSPTVNSLFDLSPRLPCGFKHLVLLRIAGTDFTVHCVEGCDVDSTMSVSMKAADADLAMSELFKSIVVAESDGVWTMAEAIACGRDVAGLVAIVNHVAWLAMKKAGRSLRVHLGHWRHA